MIGSSPHRVLAALLLTAAVLFAGEAQAKVKAKKGKTSSLPPEQAYQLAVQKMEKKKYYAARTILQEVLPRIAPEDRDLLPRVQLAIADCFFKAGGAANYGDALNGYRNFLTYFPNHERAPYGQLMVGMSMVRQALSPDRDQTMTEKAIVELEKVLTRWPDSAYAEQARATIEQCHDRLAEKERLVGRFYQKRKLWVAAIERYKTARDKYPRYNNMNVLLLDLGRCDLAVNRRDDAQEAFDRLARQDPSGKMSRRATVALRDYTRRREKEGEKMFGELSKEEKTKKEPAP